MPIPKQFWQRLTGKVAIVTGAGSQGNGVGTGKAIAYLFAREGAKVCLVDREPERAEETRAMIVEAGGEAFVCAADVTSSSECNRVVSSTVERYGQLDLLVNNVGIGAGGGALEDFDEVQWERVISVNLKSAVLMSKYAMPYLLEQRGSVTNIASSAGLRAHGDAGYGPSKAAMIALSRELTVMYGQQGVRANTVAPGHIFTPMVEQYVVGEARKLRRDIAPLGIEGDAWDVASATLFLASDEARFISGVCLSVDGGVHEVAALAAAQGLVH